MFNRKKKALSIRRRGLLFGLSLTAAFSGGNFGECMVVQAASTDAAMEEKLPDAEDASVTLRICNWEEYIDKGDWDESETIDLSTGDIIGENSLVEDFEQWYEETYGIKVSVEYSTFGTNEDLYNMLTLGDVYDLVCPSEYMFMKLIDEGQLIPYSEEFWDTSLEYNYYAKGVSPYIKNIFDSHEINGEPWSKYAAGYMWGVTGIVYNPELVTKEEASTWEILRNPNYHRRITIKDSIRECYFAAIGALRHDLLISDEFKNDPDYKEKLEEVMNDTTPETIEEVQDWLQDMKNNVYAFEVDSGKADMVSGKVAANYQWSGDAVYTMDQADEDGVNLHFTIPKESTDIYFDGWCMLKRGIGEDKAKQHAAEAFVNFISRPDSAIRNMYYIGYTSCISGGDDPRILEYIDWNYGADEGDLVEHDVTYFFTGNEEESNEDYILTVPSETIQKQLGALYPEMAVIKRASIMRYWDADQSTRTNRMWVNVRCYNIHSISWWGWGLIAFAIAFLIWLAIKKSQIARKQEKKRILNAADIGQG